MPEKACPSEVPQVVHNCWRFGVVLLASLLLGVAQPVASGLLGAEGAFDVFFSFLIFAVLLLVFEDRDHRRVAMSLGILSFLGIAAGHSLGTGTLGQVLLVGSHLLAAAFFSFALYRILRTVLTKQASGGAIFGAICGYLLLGIIWGLLYHALETASPGSFRTSFDTTAGTAARPDRSILGYYSFITLATVGYGDVTPATPLARTLAWIEAIAGQFYLAILVAGLVGFKVTQALKE